MTDRHPPCILGPIAVRTVAWGIVFVLLSAAGCAGLFGGPPAPAATAAPKEFVEARAAWDAGRYAQSARIYLHAAGAADLPAKLLSEALERAAKGAVYAGDYALADQALAAWAKRLPEAKNGWPWHSLYVQVLAKQSGEAKAGEYLAGLMLRPGVPWEVASQAGLELARRYAARGETARAVDVIRDVYDRAPDNRERAAFEDRTARILSGLPRPAFDKLAARVEAGSRLRFPYDLIVFERALREAQGRPEKFLDLERLAGELSGQGEFADKGLLARLLAEWRGTAAAPAEAVAVAKPGALAVALALPRGGALKSIGDRVARGAQLAGELLAKQGVSLDVHYIDSSDPGWLGTLAALPPEVALVGGPMQSELFSRVQESGAASARAFFTFLPSLGEAREGVTAWRFFSGPRDEASALAGFAVEYGSKDMAVLAPQDHFGARMTELFGAEAALAGGHVEASATYPPKDASKWDEAVKSLLVDGKPRFETIFIPDDFGRADGLIPYLSYNGMNSLLILGPQLWSETLSQPSARQVRINAGYYRLAVCPGAWWPDNPAPAAQALRQASLDAFHEPADFWTALGYDFIRFAAKFGAVAPGFTSEEINRRLAGFSGLDWSVAPLSWDAAGQAKQALFLFRPSVQGLVAVDKEGFRERLNSIRGGEEPKTPAPGEKQ
ncbi:MAG: ABC transporter substrate-binding protein [Desulfovibrionaceae bacterium]|nr:ABC transporter substrate-binding protein [Desulfovibrionaceae bacterium]MBF0513798.1 ABC transporter substrate-binding protein [Desulfovibrionaceae bacterium]